MFILKENNYHNNYHTNTPFQLTELTLILYTNFCLELLTIDVSFFLSRLFKFLLIVTIEMNKNFAISSSKKRLITIMSSFINKFENLIMFIL